MPASREQALFGAAVLKLSFILKRMHNQPGFRVVYHGTLAEHNLTDVEVNRFIETHRAELEERIRSTAPSLKEP